MEAEFFKAVTLACHVDLLNLQTQPRYAQCAITQMRLATEPGLIQRSRSGEGKVNRTFKILHFGHQRFDQAKVMNVELCTGLHRLGAAIQSQQFCVRQGQFRLESITVAHGNLGTGLDPLLVQAEIDFTATILPALAFAFHQRIAHRTRQQINMRHTEQLICAEQLQLSRGIGGAFKFKVWRQPGIERPQRQLAHLKPGLPALMLALQIHTKLAIATMPAQRFEQNRIFIDIESSRLGQLPVGKFSTLQIGPENLTTPAIQLGLATEFDQGRFRTGDGFCH